MAATSLYIRSLILFAIMLVDGCSTVGGAKANVGIATPERLNPSGPFSIAATVAAMYAVIDPLAPNWQIEETRLSENRYLLRMTKRRFTTGGDGEAAPILFRRVEQISQLRGGAQCRIVEYSEGIESSMPFAQRVVRGLVEVVR